MPIISLLFEAISAVCTVGLSMGITSELTASGKIIIIFLMLIGRTGVLVYGFSKMRAYEDLAHSKRLNAHNFSADGM